MQYICPNCKHIIEDIFDNDNVDTCPICNTKLKTLTVEKSPKCHFKPFKPEHSEISMQVRSWINNLGKLKAYEQIDMITNARERIRYRNIFFWNCKNLLRRSLTCQNLKLLLKLLLINQ